MFLVQILALAPAGRASPLLAGRGVAFASAAAALFAILALLWRRAARDDTADFRHASLVFVAGAAVCAAVLAGTVLRR